MIDLQAITREVCEVAREAGAFLRKEREAFDSSRVEKTHTTMCRM